eukprot:TRINITY_DN27840_c0_g1_i1.p1 TRINITY_DN27840_c0_g1~~TRINITY_DN27840_c0_g1_i1.p1  ORF type:complete len:472 (+),score=97.01 TRINITY_DN27840_c0_g1_i1:47-1462(+)
MASSLTFLSASATFAATLRSFLHSAGNDDKPCSKLGIHHGSRYESDDLDVDVPKNRRAAENTWMHGFLSGAAACWRAAFTGGLRRRRGVEGDSPDDAARRRSIAASCSEDGNSGTPSFFDRIGRPKCIVAPMVDQSEVPFRLLTRRYGANLCYTPMVNANQFVRCQSYREDVLNSPAEDRPLIVQFAGHDPETLLQAAKHVEHMCDAVDLNLGCPQGIARRGRYGAFLLEEEDLVVDIVRTLSSNLSVPVTCKIRLFRDDLPRTLQLCQRLQEAGCAMLTVHGRTRYQNKDTTGSCDFRGIAAVKAALQIPVIANGGLATFCDIDDILATTGADGVMSSEAVLENPALFCNNLDADGMYIDQDRLAREYLDLADLHLAESGGSKKKCPSCVKAHLFKLLHAGLRQHTDLRARLGDATTLAEHRGVALELAERGWSQPMLNHSTRYRPELSWYFRHRLEELSSELDTAMTAA